MNVKKMELRILLSLLLVASFYNICECKSHSESHESADSDSMEMDDMPGLSLHRHEIEERGAYRRRYPTIGFNEIPRDSAENCRTYCKQFYKKLLRKSPYYQDCLGVCATINECSTVADCSAGASCINTAEGFLCLCPPGYTGFGRISQDGCINIDECSSDTPVCSDDANCTDTDGSFICQCGFGFVGDGRSNGNGCIDILSDFVELIDQRSQVIVTALQLGQVLSNPAVSCLAILEANPNAISAYYWLRPADAPSDEQPSQFFCDMTFDCDGSGAVGGWMPIANFQPSIDGNCPSDYTFETQPFGEACQTDLSTPSCQPSSFFSVGGIEYSQVCGKAVGHVDYGPGGSAYPAFTNEATDTIDDPYVTGLSLTYGTPQMHIWSFAASDIGIGIVCPCVSGGNPPPTFVGPDYFCEGTQSFDTPLWDGLDCSAEDACSCTTNGPPYFNRILDTPTTEDIALRSCEVAGGPITIAFTSLEIYVR